MDGTEAGVEWSSSRASSIVPFELFQPNRRREMRYTYVLHSGKDGRLYTGASADLRARFQRFGGKRYLRNRLSGFLSQVGHNKVERH